MIASCPALNYVTHTMIVNRAAMFRGVGFIVLQQSSVVNVVALQSFKKLIWMASHLVEVMSTACTMKNVTMNNS